MVEEADLAQDAGPSIPLNHLGQPYSISALYPDQKYIMFRVMSKIREWLECDNLRSFKPLRCTIVGQAGSGKSVLLNTITAVMRRLFNYNNVLKVGCPTGTAAFNAFGETLHRLACQGIAGKYEAFSMPAAKRKRLLQKYKHLLCLIIDERSLLTSNLLGTTAQVLSETIFDGAGIDDLIGGLPVLILAGDDYQLPGRTEGAFEACNRMDGSKNTRRGRALFLQCSQTVFKLSTIRRVSDDKQDDKDLLGRIRTGDAVLDSDVAKIQSLHLDNIQQQHGQDEVNRLKADAIYLFWTNEKRVTHNLQHLATTNTPDNPTAIIKCIGKNNGWGKAIASHFHEAKPLSTLICRGATVSIQGKNFYPLWGLHNGACGTVKEIIFSTDHNPNRGHLPVYVVVSFPLYIGPIWDTSNPKVSPAAHCSYIIGY
jgi:energy-coupling factor transporter ATP-binding protein EcfA2